MSVVLTACSDSVPPTVPRTTRESGLSPNLAGTLHLVWGDPRARSGPPRLNAYVVDHTGRATQVVLPAAELSDFGRLRSYDGHRVVLNGSMTEASDATLGPVFRAASIMPAEFVNAAQGTTQMGNKKYLTILCKFPDHVAAADTAYGMTAYQRWIGEGQVSRTYPSINHYWYQQSYGQVNFDNSHAVGWYVMPHDRLYYLGTHGTGDTTVANLSDLLMDCTGLADPDVNFPDYLGVVVQFNQKLDCCSWGGTGWTLNYDGQSKVYGVAWMADWADQAVYAHESGHSLSLPHSSGPYGATYDSDWDVMSNSYIYWDPNTTPATYVGQGVISYDKDLLGWIAAARKAQAAANRRRTFFVDRLDQPSTSQSRLMVTIPYGASGHYYTVESRRQVGYDAHLDAEGVIVHDIDPAGHGVGRPAFIYDPDGATPVAASAALVPGDTFRDVTNAIAMTVNATTATGYGVTVASGSYNNTWSPQAVSPVAREKASAAAAGANLYVFGGSNGSGTLARVDRYNTLTDQWVSVRQLPAARSGAAVVNYNGNIFVFGGKDGTGTFQPTVWRYSPTYNSYTALATMPGAGGCGGAAVIGTSIYVYAGCNNAAERTNLLYRFNPGTNTWSTLPTSPRIHAAPVVAALGGKLYVMGGLDVNGNPTSAVDVYTPGSNSWAQAASSIPQAVAGAAWGTFNGRLYIAGGLQTTSTLSSATYMFNPTATTKWTTKSAIPTKRVRLTGAFVGDALYTVGGSSLVPTVLTKTEVYSP